MIIENHTINDSGIIKRLTGQTHPKEEHALRTFLNQHGPIGRVTAWFYGEADQIGKVMREIQLVNNDRSVKRIARRIIILNHIFEFDC